MTDNETKAEAFADSIDRRGCSYWRGLYQGYLGLIIFAALVVLFIIMDWEL